MYMMYNKCLQLILRKSDEDLTWAPPCPVPEGSVTWMC